MHPPTTETMYIGDKELKNTRENAVKQQRQVEGCHVPSLLGSPLGADELKPSGAMFKMSRMPFLPKGEWHPKHLKRRIRAPSRFAPIRFRERKRRNKRVAQNTRRAPRDEKSVHWREARWNRERTQ